MSSQHFSLEQVESLTVQALTGAGAFPDSASSMAKAVRAAERDGIPSHGLLYVPTYCEHVTVSYTHLTLPTKRIV